MMTEHDNAYAGLIEADDDSRWAFGTGFEDPLAGVDTTLPTGVHGPDLAAYCLMLGDDALVMSHRLSEWCTRAPELEEEVALANIALDLLGQTRLLLARAAAADPACAPAVPAGSPIPPEDALAFFRADTEFRCVRLVEPPNGDFAESMARLLAFSTWRLALLEDLLPSADPVLAAIADKGVKEVSYHREYAARWVVTLSLGTPESARRMQAGLGSVWRYLDELFDAHPIEESLVSKGIAAGSVEQDVRRTLAEVLHTAGLKLPEVTSIGPFAGRAGRDGFHTESLSRLLSEMQSVARAHPEGLW